LELYLDQNAVILETSTVPKTFPERKKRRGEDIKGEDIGGKDKEETSREETSREEISREHII